jgi:hypothetical protein
MWHPSKVRAGADKSAAVPAGRADASDASNCEHDAARLACGWARTHTRTRTHTCASVMPLVERQTLAWALSDADMNLQNRGFYYGSSHDTKVNHDAAWR